MTPTSGIGPNQSFRDSLQPRVIELGKDIEVLVKRFLGRRHAELIVLRQSLEAGDYDTIRRLGHDLKGAGEPFGFPELSILGAKFELAGTAKDSKLVALHIATMERYLTRVQVRFG